MTIQRQDGSEVRELSIEELVIEVTGKTLAAGEVIIFISGYKSRVTSLNGVELNFADTRVDINRLNLAVRNGIITSVGQG